jgi:hypothetical protein
VREREGRWEPKRQTQTDEELEVEHKEGHRRNEEVCSEMCVFVASLSK